MVLLLASSCPRSNSGLGPLCHKDVFTIPASNLACHFTDEETEAKEFDQGH
jgi:hypothetical protein